MMKKLLERKHLMLLAVLLMVALVEPMLADRSEHSRIFSAVVAALVNLGVLLVIFDQRVWNF
jgi:hypothetical protein